MKKIAFQILFLTCVSCQFEEDYPDDCYAGYMLVNVDDPIADLEVRSPYSGDYFRVYLSTYNDTYPHSYHRLPPLTATVKMTNLSSTYSATVKILDSNHSPTGTQYLLAPSGYTTFEVSNTDCVYEINLPEMQILYPDNGFGNINFEIVASSIGYSGGQLTIAIANAPCVYTSWSMGGGVSGGYLASGGTANFNLLSNVAGVKKLQVTPTLRVSTYGDPINIEYNGTTYYCPGAAGVNIALNAMPALGCTRTQLDGGTTMPLRFTRINPSLVTVMVYLYSVDGNHTIASSGYTSFQMY